MITVQIACRVPTALSDHQPSQTEPCLHWANARQAVVTLLAMTLSCHASWKLSVIDRIVPINMMRVI